MHKNFNAPLFDKKVAENCMFIGPEEESKFLVPPPPHTHTSTTVIASYLSHVGRGRSHFPPLQTRNPNPERTYPGSHVSQSSPWVMHVPSSSLQNPSNFLP